MFFGTPVISAFISNVLLSASTPITGTTVPIICVFGRPGAGKTTVANQALEKMAALKKEEPNEIRAIGLDLDICVPEWMKENFAKQGHVSNLR